MMLSVMFPTSVLADDYFEEIEIVDQLADDLIYHDAEDDVVVEESDVLVDKTADEKVYAEIDENNDEEIAEEDVVYISVQSAVITKDPENAKGKVGDTVTFTVEAENAASYQWQFSKDGGNTYQNTGITGNKTDTITVKLTSAYITYYWRCVVTGTDGVKVTSEGATTETQIVENGVTYDKISDTSCYVVSYVGNASSLTIPETIQGMTVIEIGESAFEGNVTLVSIDLPDTIQVIGRRAFAGCINLSSMS
jgi:hypothetical protein